MGVHLAVPDLLALPRSRARRDDYSWNIANCNHSIYHWGDPLVQEPGNKVGPLQQGLQARWDADTDKTSHCYEDYHGNGKRIFITPIVGTIRFDVRHARIGRQTASRDTSLDAARDALSTCRKAERGRETLPERSTAAPPCSSRLEATRRYWCPGGR